MEKKASGRINRFTVEVPEVGRVRFSVHIADSYSEETPAPLVLLLHYGYRGSQPDPFTGAGMIGAFQRALSDLGGVAIAPDVVGGDWTDAKNETAAVWLVQSAIESYNIDPKKVIITGFSMGGKGTWFIGSRHQDLFTAAIPIAASAAGGVDWKIPLHVIHSEKDSIVSYSAAKRHAEAVQSAGGEVNFITAAGLEHYDTPGYQAYFSEAIQSLRDGWQ